jgi:protease secretion system outer membrane protein
MRRKNIALALAAALLVSSGSAGAVGLQQAYQAALKNDPQYRMSYYENEAARENAVLGRAGLLPQVSASYATNRNVADVDTQVQTLLGPQVQSTHPRYLSHTAAVQMRQPILNLEGVMRYRQGKIQAEQGARQFEASTSDVILRVAGAYADALFAEDQVALSRVQRDMVAENRKVNGRLFERGEGTRTDMLETEARLELAEAQLVEAQDNASRARDVLAGITGMEAGALLALDALGDGFRFQDLPLQSFDAWRALALERNPALAAARLASENARLEIGRDRAGHLPRIDLVTAYSKDDAASLQTYNQNSVNRTIGIQVNIPIYQGGAVNAATRQAAANWNRARADLDYRTNQTLIELHRAHDLVQSSVAKIGALEKAVASGRLLMKATAQSIKGGVRINLDLLNAQQQLYTSQRDLAQARYGYLLGLLRLRAAAGTLDDGAVREVAAYFRAG